MYQVVSLRRLSSLLSAERTPFSLRRSYAALLRSRRPATASDSTSMPSSSLFAPSTARSWGFPVAAERRLQLSSLPSLPLPLYAALFSTTTTESSQTAPSSGRVGEQSDETNGRESEAEAGEWMVEWEEEEETEPVLGDGGYGGGIVLGDVGWGERVLSVAREVLSLHFNEDLLMYAFKISPRGYVYVRLDKLSNNYGCPSIEEIENFHSLYKNRVDELVESGEIPLDLALEVSSPGALRLLKVPEDLDRFKEMPMKVQYLEDGDSNRHQQKEGVFMVESIDNEASQCVWKLADVKENRAATGKGRPLSRKQKDWRLRLSFDAIKMVTLYLDFKS